MQSTIRTQTATPQPASSFHKPPVIAAGGGGSDHSPIDLVDVGGRRMTLPCSAPSPASTAATSAKAASLNGATLAPPISERLFDHLQQRAAGQHAGSAGLDRLDAAAMLRLSHRHASLAGLDDDAYAIWEACPVTSLALLCVDNPLADMPAAAHALQQHVASDAARRWPTLKASKIRQTLLAQPDLAKAVASRLASASGSPVDLDDDIFYNSPKLSICCGALLGSNNIAGAMSKMDSIISNDDAVAAVLGLGLFNLSLNRRNKYDFGGAAHSINHDVGGSYLRQGPMVALAVFRGAHDVTEVLLRAGADADARLLETLEPATKPGGYYKNVSKIPLLHMAMCQRQPALMQLLLDHGATRGIDSKCEVYARVPTWNGKNGDFYHKVERTTFGLGRTVNDPQFSALSADELWRLRNVTYAEIKLIRAGKGDTLVGVVAGVGAGIAAGAAGEFLGALAGI